MKRYFTSLGMWLTLAVLVGTLATPIVTAQDLVDTGTPVVTDQGSSDGTSSTTTTDPPAEPTQPPVDSTSGPGDGSSTSGSQDEEQAPEQQAPSEPEAVWPGTPSWSEGYCADGVAYAPVVTAPYTDGIAYVVNGSPESGEFSVTATVFDGRVLGDLSGTGWTALDSVTAIFYVSVAVNPCPAATDIPMPTDAPTEVLPEAPISEPSVVPTQRPTDAPTSAPATAVAAAVFSVAGVQGQGGTQTISAHALDGHGCDSTEWHFIINSIKSAADAPASITVTWANGQSESVPLGKVTGGAAHYTTTSYLGSVVTSATATIYDGWSGQFVLSHGPCGAPPTNTPTTVPTNTPTTVPTNTPTNTPTTVPTMTPTSVPTNTPTTVPTNTPTTVPTNTPTTVPTLVPTDVPTKTPKIISIDASCAGGDSLTVQNPVAGATITLVLTYHVPGSSDFVQTSNTAIITLVDGQTNYPFSIDSITGVPAEANTVRVEVQSTSISMDGATTKSVSYGPCGTTPTTTPTTIPTNTPTNTPTTVPTMTPTSAPTNTPTSAPTNTPTTVPTNTPTNTPTTVPTMTPTTAPTSTPTDEYRFCHQLGNGKYNNPSSSAQGIYSGHLSQHPGDIIPPFEYQGQTYSQNWDAAGQAIFNNGCAVPDPVVPQDPDTSDGSCLNGAYTAPTITPATTEGVSYVVSGPDNKGDFTVTASLTGTNATWGPNPAGWSDGSNNTRVFSGHVELNPCQQASPGTPDVEQAQCLGGRVTAPSLTLANTDAITYSWDSAKVVNGGTVTITATLVTGHTWGDLNGWTQTSPTTATLNVNFDNVKCEKVSPASPELTQASCVGGKLTPPTLTLANSDAITYSWNPAKVVSGGSVTIKATLADGYAWGDMNGWTKKTWTTADLTVTFDNAECIKVSPATPELTQAQCVGGKLSTPTLTISDTEAISYTWNASKVVNGGSVTIKATLADGYAWGDMNGWTKKTNRTADLTVTFDNVECVKVSPATPEITQASCIGGKLNKPTLTLVDTDAITYTWNPAKVISGGTVTIKATLADGYAWGDMNGWTKKTNKTADLTITFDNVQCENVSPATPEVTQAQCIGGALTVPTLALADSAGITYTWDASKVVNGGSVLIKATLADGYAWGDMNGWTKKTNHSAEITVTFDNVECTPASPVDPVVTQASCIGGTLTPPTIATTDTDAISYSLNGGVAPGATVLVTATLADGYAWGDLGNWTRVSDTTATMSITLENVECTQVVPAAPIVTNAVCTGGALTTPTLQLQQTTGIVYSTDTAPTNGGTVVVTATVQDNYGWAANLPADWTKVDARTATYIVQFDNVDCEYGGPVDPVVTQASCIGGALTSPTVTVSSNDDIVYTFNQDDVVNGGTVVVTATVQDGYAWTPEMPAGWTRIDDATATFTVHLDLVDCEYGGPIDPEVTQASCVAGTLTPPSIVVHSNDDIVYTVDPDEVVNGGTVVVTATVQDGYAWTPEMPAGWTRIDSATATYMVHLDKVECTPVTPTPPVVTPTPGVTPIPGKGTSVTASQVSNLPVTGSGSGVSSTAPSSTSDGMVFATILLFAALAAGALGWTVRNRADRQA